MQISFLIPLYPTKKGCRKFNKEKDTLKPGSWEKDDKAFYLYFLFIIEGQFSVSRVHVKDLLAEGTEKGSAVLRPHKYSVVRADQSYCGEIEVGITFTLKVIF